MKIESGLPIFARVNDRLARIAWDLSRARKFRSKSENCADEEMLEGYDDTIGRSLHNIYCGIEGILHDFAAEIDEALPKAPKFHTDLLRQMTTATTSRPSVMRHSPELRTLMRFRHAFRNACEDMMKHHWLLEILESVEKRVIPDLEAGLVAMKDFLDSKIQLPKHSDPSPRARNSPPCRPSKYKRISPR